MSRRRPRTDGLSSYVTNRITGAEVNDLIAELTALDETYLDDLRHALEQRASGFRQRQLTQLIRALRSPELWSLLHDGSDSPPVIAVPEQTCRNCGRELPARPPGTRGRRREFCGSACRQMEYRDRKYPDQMLADIRYFARDIALMGHMALDRTDRAPGKPQQPPAPGGLAELLASRVFRNSGGVMSLDPRDPDSLVARLKRASDARREDAASAERGQDGGT